jgi:pimeloyl-ACP methyl ester carboxylesterase
VKPQARPHFVTIPDGQLRLWCAGRGTAVVVLPGLIRAARTVCEALAATLEGRAVCVFELPGLGASSAPAEEFSISSISKMLGDAIHAEGLSDAPVVAFDLAAPLALALPAGAPRFMTELDSARSWARQAFRPGNLQPRDDGTHLTALFAHLRNAHVLDPDGSRRAARDGLPLPDAQALNDMILEAGWSPQAYAALWSVCLQAIPPLADQRTISFATLADELSDITGPDHVESSTKAPRDGLWRDHVDIPRGRVHLRRAGHSVRPDRSGLPVSSDRSGRPDRSDHPGRPLIALHSAPGSAAPLQRLIEGLGESREVIAPDFIGNGDSSRPDAPVDIARLGLDVIELAAALGLSEYDLWGTHTGALVALEAAIQAPGRVGRVVLEAPPILAPEFAADLLANYFPEIVPDTWGLHLQQAWNMRRDMFLFWPWYRMKREAARPLPVPDAEFLHQWVMGLLTSGRTYHRSYRAAFEYDTRKNLPRLSAPVMLCAGPADMLADALVTARPLLQADAVIAATPATVWYPNQGEAAIAETVMLYRKFLDGQTID